MAPDLEPDTETMTAARTCSTCGSRLPDSGPCPKCLLGFGFEVPDVTDSRETTRATEQSGDRIGSYKILEKIGEGGCGVVYLAEQEEPIRRRVAVKVIKLGMDTRSVIARFDAERQALALMDHPNIAKVFDAGATEKGRPFFVMELVSGPKITDYCDRNKLSTEQRLELFVQVCRAVQHAHQKGIIHRDIKPSNILVAAGDDGSPILKVIDFGIAKTTTDQPLTDKTLFTVYEQFIGTPAYMSPEQAGLGGLDIDTRSDIYSLGVLLYELLTGQSPFDLPDLRLSAIGHILHLIREHEPLRPSARLTTLMEKELGIVAERRRTDPTKLRNLVRGDLDWIVMKALEKDRTRRYERANSLLVDIQHHLTNEPVVARPPSTLYRFCKFARRNRLVLVAGTATTMALGIGGIIAAWQAIRASNALQGADAQARLAKSVIEYLKSDFLRQADSREQANQGHQGKGQLTVHEALDRAAQRIGTRFGNEPLVEASIRATIGETYVNISEANRAIPHLERALELRRKLLDQDQPDTLASMHLLALGYRETWQTERAIALFEDTLNRQQIVLGDNDAATLRTGYDLGMAYRNAKRFSESIAVQSRVLEQRRVLLGPDHPDTLHSISALAVAYSDSGDEPTAIPLFEESLRGRRARLGPGHPDTLWSMNGVAGRYLVAGKVSEAAHLYEEAFTQMKFQLGYQHHDTAMVLENLALAYGAQGRESNAAAIYLDTINAVRPMLTNNPSQYMG
jgi:serine/threonine protein kinase/tetratricopeptide (TPR) repeat protein